MQFRWTLAVSVVYGFVLCAMGVLVAGLGHGTYTLIGLAGAPFSFLGIPISIAAALTQWMLLVRAGQRLSASKAFYVASLMLHYVSALLLSLPSSKYADWSYVGSLPQSLRRFCRLVLLLSLGAGLPLERRASAQDGQIGVDKSPYH